MTAERALYADLAAIYDSWLTATVKAVSERDPNLKWTDAPECFVKLGNVLRESGALQEFEQVLSEVLRGQLHSVLIAFDGGTALAETTPLRIFDSEGTELPRNLHEEFVAYLLETGRLK